MQQHSSQPLPGGGWAGLPGRAGCGLASGSVCAGERRLRAGTVGAAQLHGRTRWRSWRRTRMKRRKMTRTAAGWTEAVDAGLSSGCGNGGASALGAVAAAAVAGAVVVAAAAGVGAASSGMR